jgi:chemotaxis protein CheY-P-specific phosphatase CheC
VPSPRTTVESGARAAALAIGRILRRPGMAADVDEPVRAELEARLGARAVGIWFTVTGDSSGRFAALVAEQDAVALAGHLVRENTVATLGERELAALSELGNIAASAFLNGIAALIRGSMVPSVPELIADTTDAVLNVALGEFDRVWAARIDVDQRVMWLVWRA